MYAWSVKYYKCMVSSYNHCSSLLEHVDMGRGSKTQLSTIVKIFLHSHYNNDKIVHNHMIFRYFILVIADASTKSKLLEGGVRRKAIIYQTDTFLSCVVNLDPDHCIFNLVVLFIVLILLVFDIMLTIYLFDLMRNES